MTAGRVRVLVSGRVQGVFFRATCAREARARGLTGFVRNLPDGRVEAAFEGDRVAIDALVGWCRRGPEGARVDSIDVEEEEPRGDDAFHVVR